MTTNPSEQNKNSPLLEVKGLKVRFKTERGISTAIDGISFHINPGETLGVVGESGCGKTVTGLSILRLVPIPPAEISEGQVLFKGKNLLELSESEMRKVRGKEISMIFQEPMTALNPVFTIKSQMIDVLRQHTNMTKKQALEKAIDMLKLVGIPAPQKRIEDYPHQLSGGMRQRVMIAMALSCSPSLLIADEPTTALDVTIQAQVVEQIKELQQKMNTAVLMVTHDLGVVAETCDRVMVMYCGQIIEVGPVKEIFAQPQHPYTKGLLASIPKIRDHRIKKLPTIEGTVPDLFSLPKGCRFSSRCSKAIEQCHLKSPELKHVALSKEHQVACYVPNTSDKGN